MNDNKKHRIYIALTFDDTVNTLLSDVILAYQDIKEIKIVNDFHLTLKFMGDVNDELLEKTIAHLKEFKFWSFPLTLTKTALFPSIITPQYIVADVLANDKLMTLKKVLEEYMFKLYEKDERSFRPHVTLVRNSSLTAFELSRLHSKHEKSFDYTTSITSLKLLETIIDDSGRVLAKELLRVDFE